MKHENKMRWDLSTMYKGPNDPKIAKDVAAIKKASAAFEKKHKGRLGKYSEKDLLVFLKEREKLIEKSYILSAYSELLFSADANPAAAALLQRIELAVTEIRSSFIFIDLEISKRKDLPALAKSPKLKPYNIVFEEIMLFKKHYLSHEQEDVLNKKSITGRDGWSKLYEQNFSNAMLRFKGKEVTKEQVYNETHSQNRATRKEAAGVFSGFLKKNLDLNVYIYNMILLDKFQEDKMRKFSYPEESRHLSNGVPAKAIETMVAESKKHISDVSRFYKIKKRLMKLPTFTYYDRLAPVSVKGYKSPEYTYSEAVRMIEQAFKRFDPEFAAIFKDLIETNRVDAEVRKGKRGGGFCMYMSKELKPYILINFFGKPRDVQTLAHEAGHAIHDRLAAGKNPLSIAHPPLTLSEIGSIFGEMIMFEDMISKAKTNAEKIVLLSERIDDIISTVYRQIVFHIFEQKAHRHLQETGELSEAHLKQFWLESQKLMFGNSVAMDSDYETWWSFISHFYATPFYVYAYAFANLLVFAIYQKHKDGEPDFVRKYKNFLSLGGTKTTADAAKEFGFDLNDPAFWRGGFKLISGLIDQLEALC